MNHSLAYFQAPRTITCQSVVFIAFSDHWHWKWEWNYIQKVHVLHAVRRYMQGQPVSPNPCFWNCENTAVTIFCVWRRFVSSQNHKTKSLQNSLPQHLDGTQTHWDTGWLGSNYAGLDLHWIRWHRHRQYYFWHIYINWKKHTRTHTHTHTHTRARARVRLKTAKKSVHTLVLIRGREEVFKFLERLGRDRNDDEKQLFSIDILWNKRQLENFKECIVGETQHVCTFTSPHGKI